MQFLHTQFAANVRCCSTCYRIPPLSDRAGLWEESGTHSYTRISYLRVGKIYTITGVSFLVMLLIL